MNVRRFCFALTAILALTVAASAQNQMRGNWGAKYRSRTITVAAPATAADDLDSTKSPILPDDSKALVGSWTGTFTPAENDPIQFPPLPALFTFNSDGTVIGTDGGALAPIEQTYGSPSHGVWKRLGKRRFELKNIIIVVNADGTLFLTGTVRLVIQLSDDGKSFSGTGSYSFLDQDGVDYGTGDENIVGEKISLD
ncbi:MAG TPA: hypothetical protein VN643_11540 [Pyrinomonadaceae bacterium]|nr:hypothetical protein [Pyrinomonadaceae bacterium]